VRFAPEPQQENTSYNRAAQDELPNALPNSSLPGFEIMMNAVPMPILSYGAHAPETGLQNQTTLLASQINFGLGEQSQKPKHRDPDEIFKTLNKSRQN
jgi:hypothetical protein